jgi:hypothetical protein
VSFDGDPVWSLIKDNDLKLPSTRTDVFQLEPASTIYLRHDKIWLKATASRSVVGGRIIAGLFEAPEGRQLVGRRRTPPGGGDTVPTVS